MKPGNVFALLFTIAAPTGAGALKLLEHDILAAEGVFKLGFHLAANGLPSPAPAHLTSCRFGENGEFSFCLSGRSNIDTKLGVP